MTQEMEQPARMIDLTPLGCTQCGHEVQAEDAYCEGCGHALLEEKPQMCLTCGKPLHAEATFCSGCGKQVEVVEEALRQPTDPLPRAPVETNPSPEETAEPVATRPQLKRRIAIAAAASIIVAGLAIAAWFFLLRGPDLTTYDAGFSDAMSAAERVEDEMASLNRPAELDAFAREVRSAERDAEKVESDLVAIESEDHRLALEELVTAEREVFSEFIRLATLPSAEVNNGEFSSLRSLLADFDTSFSATQELRTSDGVPGAIDLDAAPLRRALLDLAAYRERVLEQRARIKRHNSARAAELATVEAFVGEFDGIVGRYAASRTELSDWIESTNAGATWDEAYTTLGQQQERRSALRAELAGLETPAEFTEAKNGLLSIMDQAIDAVGAASRGMREYQFDWSYWDFRETPGWIEFESATDTISSELSSVLGAYEATKSEVIGRLSHHKELPELPD